MNQSEVINNKSISISLGKVLYLTIKRIFDIQVS